MKPPPLISVNEDLDALDIVAAEILQYSNVPAHDPRFMLELCLYLALNSLHPDTKFMDLPRAVRFEIARRASVSLRVPVN